MTLDPLKPLLACALTAVGGLVLWAAFVSAQPDHRPAAAAARPRMTRPTGRALRLDGASALVVRDLRLPAGPFTAECWAICDDPYGTQSVFGNTDLGGFEIVWRDEEDRHPAPWPTAWVRTERTLTSEHAGWTAVPSADPPTPKGWTHVALTSDGTRLRLFVNGKIAGDRALLGAPVPSRGRFFVGADADEEGEPTARFRGLIDELRISSCVRYEEEFRPRARHEPDAETVLLLTFDDPSAPWRDTSLTPHEVRPVGRPQDWPLE